MVKSSNKKQFGKVAVLMGGLHAEREISLMSGKAAYDALIRENIDAHLIDVGKDIATVLMKGDFDRVFIALHGNGGEDGSIQGILEYLELPYTGSNILSSALCMDKQRAKCIWTACNLPTPNFLLINSNISDDEIISKLGLPIAIKPTNEGSSLGVTKVSDKKQLKEARILASEYHNRVIAEKWIQGKELTVSILGEQVLPTIQIKTPRMFYDYDAKYFVDSTEYLIPSGLSKGEEEDIRKLAFQAFKALGCRHWGRVDVMQNSKGDFWLLEVNTIPGLTSHSLVPMAASAVGINFDDLIIKILEQTV